MATTLRHLAEYLPLRALSTALHAFPPSTNLHTAGIVADLFALLGPHRVARAVDNIRASFPQWSDERVQQVARASIRHMFQVFMVDSFIMPRSLTPTSWPQAIEVGEIGPGLELLLSDQAAIFLTGHFGNWELLGFTLATIGFPLHAIARPLDNPLLNRWLLGVREARGMRVITKWGATPQMLKLLEGGGRVAFIADQNAGDDGLFVPFFGRMASCYKSIGLLALRYRVPVVAGAAIRVGQAFRYRVEATDVIRPAEWLDHPDPLFYITARYARAIETMVRKAPEQYLWIHRRWKSRPRYEREGRPLPDTLRAKLESLPWMTPAEIETIAGHSPSSRTAVSTSL